VLMNGLKGLKEKLLKVVTGAGELNITTGVMTGVVKVVTGITGLNVTTGSVKVATG
jgi:hypothetical protein